MELPFERAAMRNDELPGEMSQSDNKAFLALRWIYRAYKAGNITRERAKLEKDKIVKAWRHEQHMDELSRYRVKLTKAIETAASEYTKNRTLENADRFINIFYGFDRPWVGKDEQ